MDPETKVAENDQTQEGGLTDLSSLSAENVQELEAAINTPGEKPKDETTEKKAEEGDDATQEKKEDAETSEEEPADVLDIDKEEPADGDKKEKEKEKSKEPTSEDKKEGVLDVTDFQSLLKDTGIDLPKDITKPEEFQEALKAGIEKIKEQTKAEYFDEVSELAGLSPQAQFFLNAIKLGAEPEQLQAPGKSFDEMISKNDDELVLANMIAEGYNEEDAVEERDILKEDGKLEREASRIRNGLNADKERFVNNYQAKQQEYVQKRLEDLKIKSEAFDNKVVDAILKTETIFGVPITQPLRDALVSKFKTQQVYRTQLTSNPEFLANMILKNELAEKAIAIVRKSVATEAQKAEKLANHKKNYKVEDISKGDKSSQESQAGPDGFDAWKAIREQKVAPAG